MQVRSAVFAAALIALFTGVASAHPNHTLGPVGDPSALAGFATGFFHPLLGFDHLLAMFAVGLLGAQLGGRALWLLPAAFLGLMGLGGALGMAGYAIHLNEIGIALSVVALGLALAVGQKYPLAAAAVVVGMFGLLHGHAHGTEMPAMAAGMFYGAGMGAATLILHVAGVGLGTLILKQPRYSVALRYVGAVISLAGLAILAQVF